MLLKCLLASKVTTVENTVVYSVDDCYLLFVQIIGGNTSHKGKDTSLRIARSRSP